MFDYLKRGKFDLPSFHITQIFVFSVSHLFFKVACMSGQCLPILTENFLCRRGLPGEGAAGPGRECQEGVSHILFQFLVSSILKQEEFFLKEVKKGRK
jgi:hypothetical protein